MLLVLTVERKLLAWGATSNCPSLFPGCFSCRVKEQTWWYRCEVIEWAILRPPHIYVIDPRKDKIRLNPKRQADAIQVNSFST
jgi:hypothetical protein